MKGRSSLGRSRIGLCVGLIVFIGSACGCGSPQTSPRHVVLISIDTLRQDRLPCYGYSKDIAPFISELASESVVFDNAIAAASVTVPSHASIFTGLGPPRHGALNNKCRVRDDAVLLAEILSQRGFHTAAFVGGSPLRRQLSGLERGFEVYDDDFGAGNQRTADETVRRVDDWLNTSDVDRPIFLFVHFYDPHYPYDPPSGFVEPFLPAGADHLPSPPYPEFIQMRNRGLSEDETRRCDARYDGEIRFVDHHLGAMLKRLEMRGVLNNSLLILVADHGETLGERQWPFDHGCRLYDEQIRVPLMIRFPGGRFAGQRTDGGAHHVDLLPTILDWLDIEVPGPAEGVSLLQTCAGESTLDERRLFSIARRDLRRVDVESMDKGDFGFIASVRTSREKLIAYPVRNGFALEYFDLSLDPAELVNLTATRVGRADQLWSSLIRWLGDRPEMLREIPETFAPKLKPKVRKALEELGYLEAEKPDSGGRPEP